MPESMFRVPHRGAGAVEAMRELRDLATSSPRDTGGRPVYPNVQDAAATMGLDAEKTRTAENLIGEVATDSRELLDVAKAAREAGFASHEVREILARGHVLADRVRRGESIGYDGMAKARAAPEGTRSVHGGKKVIKQGGKWIPDRSKGSAGKEEPEGKGRKKGKGKKPAGKAGDEAKGKGKKGKGAEDPGGAGDSKPEDKGKPEGKGKADAGAEAPPEMDPEVRARYKALKARAKAAGIDVRGKLHPDHTHDHLDTLEEKVKAHEKAVAKYGESDGNRDGQPPAEDGEDTPAEDKGAEDGGIGAINPSAERPQGHDKPKTQHEQHALVQEIHDLRAKLDELEKRLSTPAEKAMHKQLTKETEQVAKDPSPQAKQWLSQRVLSFMAIITGMAVGGALGGPAGAAAGAVVGAGTRFNPGQNMRRSMPALDLRTGRVVLVKARVPNKLPGGEADDADTDEFDPEQFEAGKRVEAEHTSDPEVAAEIAADHLREDPQYYTKLARMEGTRKVPPPPPSKRVRKAALRAPHPVNEHGHRDGLTPGMRLQLRSTHARMGEVIVKSEGQFELSGETYDGSHALLTEIYGHKGHGMTARRYFRLGGQRSDSARLLPSLRHVMKAEGILVQHLSDGRFAMTGDLVKAGVPAFMLPAEDAQHTEIDHHAAAQLISMKRSP